MKIDTQKVPQCRPAWDAGYASDHDGDACITTEEWDRRGCEGRVGMIRHYEKEESGFDPNSLGGREGDKGHNLARLHLALAHI